MQKSDHSRHYSSGVERKRAARTGGRIKALHIHDNDGEDDEHLAPFTGSINWPAFCECMRNIGYSGDFSFETFQQTTMNRLGDERMVTAYLRMIREAGTLFRERILAK